MLDAIVIINLCVPTASGVPLQLLPRSDQRRAHHRHRRAWLWRTHPRRSQRRAGRCHARSTPARKSWPGRCKLPARARADKPTIAMLGEMFPADPVIIGRMLEPMGLAAGPVVPTREWRELYAALDCAAVAAIHPSTPPACASFEAAGRTVVGSAPVGHDGTEAWLQAIGHAARRRPGEDRRGQEHDAAGHPGRRRKRHQRPHHAQWLRGLGAAARPGCWWRVVPTCAMWAPRARAPSEQPDREWLESRGVQVQLRASLEDDRRRRAYRPTWPLEPPRWCKLPKS